MDLEASGSGAQVHRRVRARLEVGECASGRRGGTLREAQRIYGRGSQALAARTARTLDAARSRAARHRRIAEIRRDQEGVSRRRTLQRGRAARSGEVLMFYEPSTPNKHGL